MFHVEEMNSADFEFAVNLANTMSWGMTVEDFMFSVSLEPNGCFVAFDGSERVGIATTISYGSLGWFGNLVVTENYRKKGIGSLLISHSLNYLQKKGTKTVGLYAYDNLVDFYGKFGFEYDSEYFVLSASKIKHKEIATTHERINENNIGEIIEFDRKYFGASREKLLTSIINKKENFGILHEEGNKLRGYVMAKVSDQLVEVGPLVCEDDGEVSLRLFNSVFSRFAGSSAFLCVSGAERRLYNTSFINAGFREEFKVGRMFLGSPIKQDRVYLVESLERG